LRELLPVWTLVLCLVWFEAASAEPQAQVRLEITAGQEMDPAFLWTRDRCAEDDIPDTPLRAVRVDKDHVIAFATHEQNRAFLGSSLGAMKRDCRIVFAGRHSDRPEDYSDRVWIASTWSEDGRTIFALGHDEYQAHRRPGGCRFATYTECWWNAIVLLRSDDGGRSFSGVGDHPVATIPSRQDVDQGHSRGFYEPSNIVKHGDAYYALIRASAEGAEPAGTCLFRTEDLTRPESWRFYDGRGFSPNVDPYREDVRNAKPCARVKGLRGNVGSVTYAPAFGVYVAVSAFGSKTSRANGFYYSISTDLIHWSEGRLFLPLPTPWSASCGEDRFAYPSLVDPRSPSRNFDIVGSDPYLYFVRQHFDGCQGTMQRDLVRMKVGLSRE
jgi:hypothetical protein